MLEKLLALENCFVVDDLPEETLYIDRDKFPPVQNHKTRYSKEILVTRNEAVMVVRTFHPDWGSPVKEVYLKKDFWTFIEEHAKEIIDAYNGKVTNESNWRRNVC